MVNLEELAKARKNEGYSDINAEARVCQDIVLKAISKSDLNRNVTIKGGVVMRSITGNIRRATQDMDFDFLRYSLSETSIRHFILYQISLFIHLCLCLSSKNRNTVPLKRIIVP